MASIARNSSGRLWLGPVCSNASMELQKLKFSAFWQGVVSENAGSRAPKLCLPYTDPGYGAQDAIRLKTLASSVTQISRAVGRAGQPGRLLPDSVPLILC